MHAFRAVCDHQCLKYVACLKPFCFLKAYNWTAGDHNLTIFLHLCWHNNNNMNIELFMSIKDTQSTEILRKYHFCCLQTGLRQWPSFGLLKFSSRSKITLWFCFSFPVRSSAKSIGQGWTFIIYNLILFTLCQILEPDSLIEAVCYDGLNNALPCFNDFFPC